MIASRVIRKSLAGEEDILLGKGIVNQVRNGSNYPISRINVAKLFSSVADMIADGSLTVDQTVDVGGTVYLIVTAGSGTADGINYIDLVSHQAQLLRNSPSTKVQWAGPWKDGEYKVESLVQDGLWTMITNKVTSDRAAPQEIGGLLSSIDPLLVPTVSSQQASIKLQQDFTLTKAGYLKGLYVWVPGVSQNLVAKVELRVDGEYTTLESITVVGDKWELATLATGVQVSVGSLVSVRLTLYQSNEVTELVGSWAASVQAGVPLNGTFTITNTADNITGGTLSVNYTDLDGANRGSALNNVAVGSVVRLTELGDLSRSTAVVVTAIAAPVGQYTSYTYDWIDTGIGGAIRTGLATSVSINEPVVASTSYPVFTTPAAPAFATTTSQLFFDGVDQLAPLANMYGLRLMFQEALFSLDWEIVAVSAIGEPADSTILKQANIGVDVQAFDPFLGTPVGAVVIMDGDVLPAGLLKRNGASLLRASYPALWTYAQSVSNLIAQATKDGDYETYAGYYGLGDGATTFSIPDSRGEFLRGLDDGRGVDTGRVAGSWQDQAYQSHDHDIMNGGAAHTVGLSTGPLAKASFGNVVNTTAVYASGGAETRPRNTAMMFCVKY